jgi:hypothetical protein
MSRRHGALHLASAQYPTTRDGKARWQGGLHPERTQCTQVSCGTPPVSVRLLHLNDHVRIRLQMLGWVGRARLVAWVPAVLCAALDSAQLVPRVHRGPSTLTVPQPQAQDATGQPPSLIESCCVCHRHSVGSMGWMQGEQRGGDCPTHDTPVWT